LSESITVPYRAGNAMAEKKFTVYRTHRGPVIHEADGTKHGAIGQSSSDQSWPRLSHRLC
jgi:hypothetical protein